MFDLSEVPKRKPPESPLAPQWYKLEAKSGKGRAQGTALFFRSSLANPSIQDCFTRFLFGCTSDVFLSRLQRSLAALLTYDYDSLDCPGEIMVAVWWGTQADEAFPEAWHSDTGGHAHFRSKVYLSPKLWYLRVNVIEAQDLNGRDKARLPEPVYMTVVFQLFLFLYGFLAC
jgi:hypothetical protein